ncbi:carbon catabolite repressor protein 4 homolog 4 [Ricinus communis]|uniref:carbon catabolite repressor protein 4 homolog 4 n=1 Tax=Ricinus communis TaxID=3988 RepID=UPI00201AC019|nr:carbon catabolite repressor protein 4 homolog 4 [Ricinus communis]
MPLRTCSCNWSGLFSSVVFDKLEMGFSFWNLTGPRNPKELSLIYINSSFIILPESTTAARTAIATNTEKPKQRMLKLLVSLPTRLPFPSFTRTICMRKMTTAPSPISPKFIPVQAPHVFSTTKPDGIRVRLVSYNILAQVYVKSSYFPHCPSPSLKWKSRSKAILTILKNLEADFLCLQEVDEYDSFYKQNMEIHGYSSIYIQRSGQKRDGCGIFYKHDCAELLLEERIEYNDLVNSVQEEACLCGDKPIETDANGDKSVEPKNGASSKSTPEDRGDPNDPRVRLKRDCVGIMAAFRLKDAFRHIVIVANTHLYWDPEWADVKLAQAKYLLSRLSQFKILVSNQFECSPSLFLAGDFNSIPGDKVYQYVVSGNSSFAPTVECLDDLPIPLCSVYGHTRGEPPFTNCTPDFTNTLDYIFFSPDEKITPISFLELPEGNSPDVLGGLPNFYHPSDHLPIGAEFEISRE